MTKTDSDVSQAVETASSHYNFSYQIARVSGFHLHASTLTTTVQVASLPLLNTGPSKRCLVGIGGRLPACPDVHGPCQSVADSA